MPTEPRFYRGPLPDPNFGKLVAATEMQPDHGGVSGEVTASSGGLNLGTARYAGKILNVGLSVLASGKDDSNDLYVEADVLINGVSALTTKPRIAHVSGEASSQKTTLETGDTGITQCVVNAAACEFAVGDVIQWNMLLTRTASPTTEISNPAIVVEVEPI
jgi:hypothetical protein